MCAVREGHRCAVGLMGNLMGGEGQLLWVNPQVSSCKRHVCGQRVFRTLLRSHVSRQSVITEPWTSQLFHRLFDAVVGSIAQVGSIAVWVQVGLWLLSALVVPIFQAKWVRQLGLVPLSAVKAQSTD